MSFRCCIVLDELKDALTIYLGAALIDNCVADLTNENKKAGWGVVVGAVLPDKKDSVHDGYEQLSNFWQLLGLVHKINKSILEGSQEFEILSCFNSSH